MLNCENSLNLSLTRRQLLRLAIGGTTSLLLIVTRPAVADESPRLSGVETFNPITAKAELTTEMSQRFNLVFPESNIPEGRDLYWLANLHKALMIYGEAGITNFSNNHAGKLNIVVNTEGKTLNGKTPFENAIAYYRNDGLSQLVFSWPQEGFPKWWLAGLNSNSLPTGIEFFYNQQAIMYAMHELYHPLQHRTIAPTPEYNHSRVLLTPDMQNFAQTTGIVVTSSEREIETKPPWELNYQYQGDEPWIDALRKFDWRVGTLPNPIVEGSAVSVSDFLWNRSLFKDKFPHLARWAEQEIERLKAG